MADDQSTPVDTQTLVAWLDRIAAQHTANRIAAGEDLSPEVQNSYQQLDKLRAVLLGHDANESAIEAVRLLIAGGVAHWRAPASIVEGDVSNLLIQELLLAALWPLVITPKMPPDWQDALQTITSPDIRQLIVDLRENDKQAAPPVLAQRLSKALVTPPYAAGVANLIEDLRDDQRGGAAHSAIITVRDGQKPAISPNTKALLWWILTSAGAGIIGNRIDAWGFVPFWEYVFQQPKIIEPSITVINNRAAQSVDLSLDVSTLPLSLIVTYVDLVVWGNEHLKTGNYEQAMMSFNEAMLTYPSLGSAFVGRGRVYRSMGDLAQAIADFTEAIHLDPSDDTAYYHRGLANEHCRDYSSALFDYETAVTLAPDEADYKIALNRLLRHQSSTSSGNNVAGSSVLARFLNRRNRNRAT
jgi:hypothetical protein